ncbi:MAG: hypothetical protein QXS41_03975 [Candidatus Woesearchaeota archaeon]
MYLIKLFPKKDSKFVFGNSFYDSSKIIFHSDSLASAIINNLISINREVSIENFPKISSLFYGVCGKKDVLFIPLVRTKEMKSKIDILKKQHEDQKLAKKIKFQSIESLFSDDLIVTSNKKYLVTREEFDYISNIDFLYFLNDQLKNNIDKNSESVLEEGGLYDIEYLTLEKNVFFYFIAEEIDSIKKGIDLIKINGLGGRRSIGYGEIDHIEYSKINFLEEGDKYLSLSVIFFKDSSEFEKVESYEIYKSRGFIGYPVWNHRTKEILGVMEGAILSDKIEGKNFENVAPESLNVKIPRIGKPLLIKVK